MSRRAPSDGSSLELFLDTICNTFGGILFISMLVVTLLNLTSKSLEDSPPSEMTQLELINAERAREQATAELEQLRQAVVEQGEISNILASEVTISLARAVQKDQERHARLVSQKSNTVGQVSVLQTDLNRMKQETQDRKSKIERAKRTVVAIKKKLEDTVDDRSKKAVIPKVSETNLLRATFFLTGGKLYGPRFLQGGSKNTADFIESSSGGSISIEPNPSGGAIVDPTGQNTASVNEKLTALSSSKYFVKLFVWPDSFEHCNTVHRTMESRGLKSDRTPLEAGVRIIIGGASQGPSYVQP